MPRRKRQEASSSASYTRRDMTKPKTPVQVIKDAVKGKKLLIGTRAVLKGMKNTTVATVICASNCPRETRNDVEHYGDISKTEVMEFKGDSSKLGEACGKPFKALVVGIEA